jgi:hypothetical protein
MAWTAISSNYRKSWISCGLQGGLALGRYREAEHVMKRGAFAKAG